MLNYYAILGIAENATQQEIKAAFKKLALKYHPDKNNGDAQMEERFKEINLAYQILSNPFEKAKYDISLMYASSNTFSTTSPYEQPTYHKQEQKRNYKRPEYTEPKINWRENWIATAYAFGFTIIVASLFMLGITIKEHFEQQAYEERLAARRDKFNALKVDFQNGKVNSALVSLNQLGNFMPAEKDMHEYKVAIFESFIFNGESSFNRGAHLDAIRYFELHEQFGSATPLTIKEHLARSYQLTNQPHKAIKKLKELLAYNYRFLDIYVSLAEIYRDLIRNKEEALRYFQLGDQLAVKKYESIYGKAYPLVMNGKFLPPVHYRLYAGLADIHIQLNKPAMAVKITEWNVKIWPDSAANFLTAAKGYHALGDLKNACINQKIAVGLGAQNVEGLNCN